MLSKEELRQKLRDKLEQKKMKRTPKKVVENQMEKNFKKMNIDYKKLKEDIERVNKEGGLTLNINN